MLPQIPNNLPTSLLELRIDGNEIKKIQKGDFQGMKFLHVLGKCCLVYTYYFIHLHLFYANYQTEQAVKAISSKTNSLSFFCSDLF